MDILVRECGPGDDFWAGMTGLFPRAVAWTEDPGDTGSYHFLAATDRAGHLLGGSVVDIGPMGFGPLAGMTVGFLEDIEVIEAHRRKGVGKALLRAVLSFAWEKGARSVRWTVDYENAAGIALYSGPGLAFVPEEDPDAEHPEKCYTVVAANPDLANAGRAP
jgi:GNAT superfamily N-acetyltransferase